ncbi:hypothetical protein HDV62DRAFT_212821 [Trichoderma sp. SZMC 28011]
MGLSKIFRSRSRRRNDDNLSSASDAQPEQTTLLPSKAESLDASSLSGQSLVSHQQTLRPKTTSSTGPQITVTSAESSAEILPSRQIFPSDASSTPTILSPASSGQSVTRPSLWDRAYDSLRKSDERSIYIY